MKIVIEIPDNFKDYIEDVLMGVGDSAEILVDAVMNGTPLPKGHGRLIEVTNQLEQELFTFTRYTGIDECPYESATLITDNAPTIIEADKESDNDTRRSN